MRTLDHSYVLAYVRDLRGIAASETLPDAAYNRSVLEGYATLIETFMNIIKDTVEVIGEPHVELLKNSKKKREKEKTFPPHPL